MQFLPQPPLTPDQVESLKTDNIMSEGAMGLENLEIKPTSMNIILPTYLNRYQSGGRFALGKAA
jgi:NADH dehydrogenase